jgi:LCP family protein required for cell wall assembly
MARIIDLGNIHKDEEKDFRNNADLDFKEETISFRREFRPTAKKDVKTKESSKNLTTKGKQRIAETKNKTRKDSIKEDTKILEKKSEKKNSEVKAERNDTPKNTRNLDLVRTKKANDILIKKDSLPEKKITRLKERDLLHTKIKPTEKTSGKFKEKKPKKRLFKKFALIFLLLFLLIGSFLTFQVGNILSDLKKGGVDIGIGDVLGGLVGAKNGSELLQTDGLTNTLIVGLDSRGANSGLENTDSIMVASFNHANNKLNLISVPRDLEGVFRIGKNNAVVSKDQKINAAFAIAEQNNYPGGGLALLRASVSEITGLQIHYTAQINFNAFKDVINRLDGINVDVENSFTDYTYPNDDDTGVITVSFKAGTQSMNGKTALQYARSRHSLDFPEGSDFARAKRQQKVLVAVIDKLKSTNYAKDPGAALDFVKIFGSNIKLQATENSTAVARDIKYDDLNAALKLKNTVDLNKRTSIVLNQEPGGCNSLIKQYGDPSVEYILGPTLGWGKYDEVQKFVKFVSTNPELYTETKQDCSGQKLGAFVGLVDSGLGYASTLAEEKVLSSTYISADYLQQKSPLEWTDSNGAKQTLSGVGIYEATKKYSVTKDFLQKKYNAKILDDSQVPDVIKKGFKNYDFIVFFAK